MPRARASSRRLPLRCRIVLASIVVCLAAPVVAAPQATDEAASRDRSRAALHELRDTDLVSGGLILPFARDFATPADIGLPQETATFPNGIGESLRGWFVDRPGTDRTILICMGNTGNISHTLEYVRFLYEGGFDVFVFDPQGFGGSSGRASVFSLPGDAAAAYRFLRESKKRDPSDIAILGISLGSMTALMVAEREKPAGVVIECLFAPSRQLDQLRAYASGGRMTDLGFSLLERVGLPIVDPYPRLPRIECPILFVHGVADGLLPPGASIEAVRHATSPRLWLMEGAGHSPELLVGNDREHAHQIVRLFRQAFGDEPFTNPEVSLAPSAEDPRVVRIEIASPLPRRALEIALVDSADRIEIVRLMSDAPEERRTLRPKLEAVDAHAVEIGFFVDRGDGTWEPDLSELSVSYAALRRFEQEQQKNAFPTSLRFLRQGDVRFGTRGFDAKSTTWLRENLPDPGAVHPRIRPLYVPLIAQMSLGVADERTREELARIALRYFPEDPGRHFELGNASFALGFDGLLPARACLSAAKSFLREGEFARARELAAQYLELLPERYGAGLTPEAIAAADSVEDLEHEEIEY